MANFYETDKAVSEYLLFHYAPPEVLMPWAFGPREATGFPERCVTQTFETFGSDNLPPDARLRALDLGCAVGRSTFELSRFCAEVVGIDASGRFIEAAEALRRGERLRCAATVEGDIVEHHEVGMPEGSHPERIRFEVGDALNLRADLGSFDRVLAANLVDRVPDPARWLQGLAALVRPGGQLVITSPYTWLEDYTPRAAWLAGGGRRTRDALTDHLGGFRLLRRLDLPFVIREHARKYQWSVAEATVWERV